MASLRGMRQDPDAMRILKLIGKACEGTQKGISLADIESALGKPKAELQKLLNDLVSVRLLEMRLSGKLDSDRPRVFTFSATKLGFEIIRALVVFEESSGTKLPENVSGPVKKAFYGSILRDP